MIEPAHAHWPVHKDEWKSFLFEISDHPEWSQFGSVSKIEARRIWSLMEEKLFPAYRLFVRVWPEWGSTGIWKVPYPGSRSAGSNLDPPGYLGISAELQGRFERWQAAYDNHEPWAPEEFDGTPSRSRNSIWRAHLNWSLAKRYTWSAANLKKC